MKYFLITLSIIILACNQRSDTQESEQIKKQDSSIAVYPYDTTCIECSDPDVRKVCWGMNQFNIYKLEEESDFDFNLPMQLMHYKSYIGGKDAKITYYTPFDTLAQVIIMFDREDIGLKELYKPLKEKYGKPVKLKKDKYWMDYAKWITEDTEIELQNLQGGRAIWYKSLKYIHLIEKFDKMEKQKDDQELKDAL